MNEHFAYTFDNGEIQGYYGTQQEVPQKIGMQCKEANEKFDINRLFKSFWHFTEEQQESIQRDWDWDKK